MNLCYRGISYPSASSTLSSNKTKKIGKYRGINYQVPATIIDEHQTQSFLTYRGVLYTKKILNFCELIY
jgi:hypothetical protein